MFLDKNVMTKINETTKATWGSYKYVSENFLGHHKSKDHEVRVTEVVKTFRM